VWDEIFTSDSDVKICLAQVFMALVNKTASDGSEQRGLPSLEKDKVKTGSVPLIKPVM
jgi:hypothetical protein